MFLGCVSCLDGDLGGFLRLLLSEPGFGWIYGFEDVFQFMLLGCNSCLNRDLGGFFDLRIFEIIHCLNRDLGGFFDLGILGPFIV